MFLNMYRFETEIKVPKYRILTFWLHILMSQDSYKMARMINSNLMVK